MPHEVLGVDEEQGHPGAVLAGREDLLRLVARSLERELRREEGRGAIRCGLVAEDRVRRRVARERVVRVVVALPAPEAAHGADARQRDLVELPSGEIMDAHHAVRILQVRQHQPIADPACLLQRVVRLGDELVRSALGGSPETHLHHAAARCSLVRAEVELGPLAADEGVLGLEALDELGEIGRRGRLRSELRDEHRVLLVRALRHREDEVPVVVGHGDVEHPLLLVGLLEHEDVRRLLGPGAVVVDLLEIGGGGRPIRGRLGEPRVEEPAAVLPPRSVGELRPLDAIGEILRGPDVAHVELAPVGASARQPVREELAVPAHGRERGRDGSVRGELVRIEQDARRCAWPVHHVEDRLILQAPALGVHDATAVLLGDAEPLVLEELAEPLHDAGALRDGRQVAVRELVLRVDPCASRGRVVLFQPAVRVFDLHAVVVVHGAAARCRRVRVRRCGASGARLRGRRGVHADGRPRDVVRRARRRAMGPTP